jgi:hypothetical protein
LIDADITLSFFLPRPEWDRLATPCPMPLQPSLFSQRALTQLATFNVVIRSAGRKASHNREFRQLSPEADSVSQSTGTICFHGNIPTTFVNGQDRLHEGTSV